MDKRKKTAVTIVMTCILILIMALVIMYRIKENNSKDYTKYENQNTKETSTIQSSKIGLQRKEKYIVDLLPLMLYILYLVR